MNASLATPAPNSRTMAISRARPVTRLSSTAADTTPAERTTLSWESSPVSNLVSNLVSRQAGSFLRGPHFHELVNRLRLFEGSEPDAG